MLKFIQIILIVAIVGVVTFRMSQENSMKKLVMPGPLHQDHAEFEKKCAQCHTSFDKEYQDNLCMKCHEKVQYDIENLAGFHGKFEPIKEMQCKKCHSDHLGRDSNIVPLDMETFNHKFTDFELKGAHARVSVGCDACHDSDKKFREAASDCFSCHETDDVHKGQLEKDCASCHKETGWKDASFDHSKTDFKLEGRHMKVACDLCHPNAQYKDSPVNCIDCHLINDIHDSKPDVKCDRCHGFNEWKEMTFNHLKETEYELKDAHAKLKCENCHPGNIYKKRVEEATCFSCHKNDDVHKGITGNKCQQCHNAIKWSQVKFDHDKDTDFKLVAKHKDAVCFACHKDNAREKQMDMKCISCHKADDIHKGELGDECNSCHDQMDWGGRIKFDHDLTRFPLIGLHAVASCNECHQTSSFKMEQMDCLYCHKDKDEHKGKLGRDCDICHNPNDWALWEFDHNIQTEFKLEGAHENLKCETCHNVEVKEKINFSGECFECHQKDDTHVGRLTKRCDWCHNTNEFKEVEKFHKMEKNEFLQEIESECYVCHADDDLHYGSYGKSCGRCHVTGNFLELKIGN